MAVVVVKRAGEETQQDRRKTAFTRLLKKPNAQRRRTVVLTPYSRDLHCRERAVGDRRRAARTAAAKYLDSLLDFDRRRDEIRRQKKVEIFENHTAERKIDVAIDVDGTTTITTIIINQSNYLPPYRPRTRIDAAANARAIDRTKEKVKTH